MILGRILTKHRDRIAREWIQHLHRGASERYRERPYEELEQTVGRASEANFAVLVNNDYSQIDGHIEWITGLRLQGGFSLSEVQQAYELYRTVLLPILLEELDPPDLSPVLARLNYCLFYTITRFSNYFQATHESQIRQYARNLEKEVEERTKELSESEAKYRILVEEINDGYFVNQDGRIAFANRAFCEMHGYAPAEIIGREYTEFVAHESLSDVKRLHEKRVSGEEAEILYTYFRLHRNGTSRPTENKVKLISYEGRKAVAGICRDITERIEMEKRIRESERLAHIGQLTTSLAHEIRNPLSSIKMNVQILSKNLKLDGNDGRRGQIIGREVSRLERILTEMLDFAKPLRLNREPASLNEIVDSALDVLEEKIKEKGLTVSRYRSKAIPSLLLDRDKIEQAIINMLLNSIEALAKGYRIRVVTRHPAENEGQVSVDVSDNGPGIQLEDYPYLFDPFFSSKKKGTGLGLYNVKKIAEAHGGDISVLPVRGNGTHFRLTFPTNKGHETKDSDHR
jgi:PAS domain S-box-containing protein